MKAVLLKNHGGPECLVWEEITDPIPQPQEVVVQIHCAGINHIDLWIRKGIPAYPVKLPHILGADGAGIVVKTGAEVEGVNVGDRVLIIPSIVPTAKPSFKKGQDNQWPGFEILGAQRKGTYAEMVAVPDENVVGIPDQISFEEAAGFPLAYLTAWHMLMGRGQLQPKEKVLVVGGSSGVGVAAIQIAQAAGAQIWTTTTKESKVPALKKLGAQDVFVQKEAQNFSPWVLEKTGGIGADIVVEHVGPATWDSSVKSLAPYGRLVTCGATSGPHVKLDLRYIFSRDLSILGAKMGTRKEFSDLCRTIFEGKLKPTIDKTFPASEASQAHKYLEEGTQVGKVLLKFNQ